jgi:UDP-glucose 4-epimerase
VVDYASKSNYFLIDISNADFSTVFENTYFDICINCSGAASVPDSLNNPSRDYFLNTVNTFKILDAIRKNQPECRFINLSSAAVYGNPRSLPVTENSKADPLSPYGFHKLQSEIICSEFTRFYNLSTCSLRLFSVYGDGLKKQLFWDLTLKLKGDRPFELFGTGNESRDFIHVTDLSRAIDLIIKNCQFKAEVVNVANGQEVMIKDAVSIYSGLFKNKVPYSFSGAIREGDPLNWIADISSLKSFGYEPVTDIMTGLRKYYEWVIEEFDQPSK